GPRRRSGSASGAGSSESRADAMCALLAPSLRASEPFGSRDERPRRHHGRLGGMLLAPLLGIVALATSALAAPADQITPKTFAVPERTAWRPLDCRSVPVTDPVLLPRTGYRRAHGDLESSNEVDLAYAPVFAREWVAEPGLYQVTTPAFDSAGDLY